VVEEPQIRQLLGMRAVVTGAGGGGVPVVEGPDGRYHGVEAVVDKDLAASLLACSLEADTLAILTDTAGATVNFGRADQRVLGAVSASELREIQAAGHFAAGSMGPKVEAALRFVEAGGGRVVIAHLDMAVEALAGRAGTQILADRPRIRAASA
jgi:carbamate kinase